MNVDQQQKLRKVLHSQAEHYAEILELSKTQSQLIASGKILELFPVFNKINDLMGLVQDLDATVIEEKQAWENDKLNLPENQRQAVACEVDKISVLLKEIISLEQDQQNSIGAQQKRNRKDVTKINRGQQMAKAYGNVYKPTQKPDSLLDKRT